jgi:hypothetical protein
MATGGGEKDGKEGGSSEPEEEEEKEERREDGEDDRRDGAEPSSGDSAGGGLPESAKVTLRPLGVATLAGEASKPARSAADIEPLPSKPSSPPPATISPWVRWPPGDEEMSRREEKVVALAMSPGAAQSARDSCLSSITNIRVDVGARLNAGRLPPG